MANQEKFKTMIGGQALIEGLMMRGPQKDAIVVRGKDGVTVEIKDRKVRPKNSPLNWPVIRGAVTFFDAQLTGVKALMRSADLSPEESQEEPSKFDKWLEEKLGDKRFQQLVVGIAVAMGLGLSILLFFLLPMVIGSFFDRWIRNNLLLNLVEGIVRILIFTGYMLLVSRMSEMKRVFAYHGAEHKTIRCYEAGLPLTVENVRQQTRLHPRCGTSFLLVVMIISILLFSVASSLLLAVIPKLAAIHGSFLYRLIMIAFKLLLLPLVVSFSYEINRWVGRHDNLFTRILSAPGMWFQNFTTNEPDDSMIEVGIQALEAVLPENEGDDRW
ncbi:MAG: DUF1385 domain-containing protein [Oscillospiraceae bacterium]|nr:DUF1385 domain-containing protein [Oscillospiraceae bacterium]